MKAEISYFWKNNIVVPRGKEGQILKSRFLFKTLSTCSKFMKLWYTKNLWRLLFLNIQKTPFLKYVKKNHYAEKIQTYKKSIFVIFEFENSDSHILELSILSRENAFLGHMKKRFITANAYRKHDFLSFLSLEKLAI